MKNERLRLKAVKRYLEQVNKNEDKLQDIVSLASYITGVPVAFITLIDKDIQWISVKRGYPADRMPRSTSFCTHTIEQDEVMIVPDASLDERFKDNPLVNNAPSARFYAGISLKSADGYNVGTLCVLDVEPHELDEDQASSLKALSRQVTNVMELNLSIKLLKQSIQQIEGRNAALKKISQVQSHDIRGPLTSIMGLMNLIREEGYQASTEYLQMMETAVNKLDEKICSIVSVSSAAHRGNEIPKL